MTKWRGLAWGLLLLAALESNASWAEESSLKERFLGDGGSQWEITANQLSYAEKEGVYIAEGDVVIRRAG
ncbi:MAG: hypothetical protein KKE57_06980, partial [Proteobacteria bacterium]|nr:hypothetical protein [Pseudomonadota bacterium]